MALVAQAHEGIIPAYAGSTFAGLTSEILARDHPRIRGEHGIAYLLRPVFEGSSPHTRGAPGYGLNGRPGFGIIPEYAGSTALANHTGCSSRDHPRIRGEHYQRVRKLGYREGSSPHTRGAL